MKPEDRRDWLISVRLTSAENDVVDALCAHHRCSRSNLVRMIYTATMPPVLPAPNVSALEKLDVISFQLAELAERGDVRHIINDVLVDVEATLDELRMCILGLP